MNYEKIYNQIVDRAKFEARQKLHKSHVNYVYYEEHHIIPKCLGGSNDKSNLVLLTAREHFICHWLLARLYAYNNKITAAFWAMCNQRKPSVSRYVPDSRAYQEARELHAVNISLLKEGICMKDETKKKLSEINKGQIPWNKGMKYSGDKLETVRKHLKNPDRCSKISKSMSGKKKSDEHVNKLRGKKRQVVQCPHCNVSGGANNMYRYHFDNCKLLASSFNK